MTIDNALKLSDIENPTAQLSSCSFFIESLTIFTLELAVRNKTNHFNCLPLLHIHRICFIKDIQNKG